VDTVVNVAMFECIINLVLEFKDGIGNFTGGTV
jgi:hypothetical protein